MSPDSNTDFSAALAGAEQLEAAFQGLDRVASSFGRTMVSAFRAAVIEGERLDDVLRGLALRLASRALDQALKPLDNLLGGAAQGLFSGVTPFASGGIVGSGGAAPGMSGGVLGAPYLFSLGRGLGLAGEAGPEAILPLARGADGRLGVRTSGGRAAAGPTIVFNVSTPDAASFRLAEADIAARLARMVGRGRRGM